MDFFQWEVCGQRAVEKPINLPYLWMETAVMDRTKISCDQEKNRF